MYSSCIHIKEWQGVKFQNFHFLKIKLNYFIFVIYLNLYFQQLTVHKCFESEAGVLEEEQKDDLRSLQGLFNEMGFRGMVAKDALIGWRRLGKVKQSDGQPRPEQT